MKKIEFYKIRAKYLRFLLINDLKSIYTSTASFVIILNFGVHKTNLLIVILHSVRITKKKRLTFII